MSASANFLFWPRMPVFQNLWMPAPSFVWFPGWGYLAKEPLQQSLGLGSQIGSPNVSFAVTVS